MAGDSAVAVLVTLAFVLSVFILSLPIAIVFVYAIDWVCSVMHRTK